MAGEVLANQVAVVTYERAPYNFLDEKEKTVNGLSTELVHEILKRDAIKYQIEVFPWARSYRIAQEDSKCSHLLHGAQ